MAGSSHLRVIEGCLAVDLEVVGIVHALYLPLMITLLGFNAQHDHIKREGCCATYDEV